MIFVCIWFLFDLHDGVHVQYIFVKVQQVFFTSDITYVTVDIAAEHCERIFYSKI